MRGQLAEWFYRLAASGFVPRGPFAPEVPGAPSPGPTGPPTIEIVSHCWRYHRFLAYQLSSLALHPPVRPSVTVTVFYSPDDRDTAELLRQFGAVEIPGVRWNWWPLEPGRLFRRAIGRNLAALASEADWIWFSDCDVLFYEGALDRAASILEDRDDILLFPRTHRVSEILEPDDPLLAAVGNGPRLVEIDPADFQMEVREKAVGGFQIVRGDVARAVGYCRDLPHYQRPAPRWTKTYEDRTFRWLLGTDGTPVEIPALYRIRHAEKGRDPASQGGGWGGLRGVFRRLRMRLAEGSG